MPPTGELKVSGMTPISTVDLTDLFPLLDQSTGFSNAVAPLSDILDIGNRIQAWDAMLDSLSDLSSPGADRILFWDQSDGALKWLNLGSGLSITGTTLDTAGGGGTVTGSGTTNNLAYWTSSSAIGNAPIARLSADALGFTSTNYAVPSAIQNTSGGLRLRFYDGAAPDYFGIGVESGGLWTNVSSGGTIKFYYGAASTWEFYLDKVLPTDDLVVNLGSLTQRFNNLYLGTLSLRNDLMPESNDVSNIGDTTHKIHDLHMAGGIVLGSDATGDIYYRSAGGDLTRLPIGTNGQYLTISSGLPAWATLSGGGTVTGSGTTGNIPIWSSSSAIGNSLLKQTTGVVNFTDGSTGGSTFSSPIYQTISSSSTEDNYADINGKALWIEIAALNDPTTFTGIAAGQNGEVHFVRSAGTAALTFNHDDAGSSAANRFVTSTGGNVTIPLGSNEIIMIAYLNSRWHLATITPNAMLSYIRGLTDPGADRILFWDDSAGVITWLTLGTNLSITGTTINAAGGGGFTSFTVAGDSGSSQTISDGNTLIIAGGTGIDSVASATDTITLNIDSTVATLTGSQTLTNKTITDPTLTVLDSKFTIHHNSDATKQFKFQASGITTATTRTGTLPDADFTFAGVDISNAWADGVKQTFNPNATNAGINVGSHTADPSSLANGDLWYNSTSNELKARINGASVALGAGGSGANAALSNLASVAINTTLVSDTDNTDDLGTNAIRWKNLYLSGFIGDGNGNELLKFSQTASAVNELTVINAATGNSPSLQGTGGDANIGINFLGTGSGKFSFRQPGASSEFWRLLDASGNECLVVADYGDTRIYFRHAGATNTLNTVTNGTLAFVDNGGAGSVEFQSSVKIKVNGTLTAGGTTGAQTINKSCGSVNFAASAASLVVTCNKCTTSSIVLCVVMTNDATMKTCQAVAGAGSFTLYPDAVPTAETKVAFFVLDAS